jgi:glycosyltransferase involved in cell wall biosynthesis
MHSTRPNILPTDQRQSSAFRNSYTQITEWMRAQLFAEGNVDHLLSIAQFYGLFRWSNADGVYQDNDLEDFVERRVLQNKKLSLPNLQEASAGIVLVASELLDFGGHSRVVLNWLKAFREDGNHRLLITRRVTNVFKATLESQRIPFYLCVKQGIELVNEIIACCANAEQVVLHIHPDDIVTAIAARLLARSGKRIVFYNHADHAFSFAITSAQMVCEISTYGIELNKRARRLQNSCYLGIPIECRNGRTHREVNSDKNPNKTVFSGGDSSKYVPGPEFFGEFIDSLLQQRNDVTFLLAGPTGSEPWWSDVKERWGTHIQFLGNVSHSKYLDIMQKADVYVDSFPVTGGTAFPEALLCGKLVAGLSNPIQGYSPADELKVGDVQALTERVIKLFDYDKETICKIEETMQKASTIHSITEFRERVINMYIGTSDKDARSNVTVDTHWRENRWERNKSVCVPGGAVWFRLPWSFCIGLSFRFSGLDGASGRKQREYIIRRIALKCLPAGLRNFMKGMGLRDAGVPTAVES